MSFRLSFLGIGQPKAATTTLHRILSQIAEIGLPSIKELNFLGTPSKFCAELSPTTVSRVREQYVNSIIGGCRAPMEKMIWGEISTTYLARSEKVVKTLNQLEITPENIIVCIREPIARLRSHCLHLMYYHGVGKNEISSALESDYGDIVSSSYLCDNLAIYRENLKNTEKTKYHIVSFDKFIGDPITNTIALLGKMNIRHGNLPCIPIHKSAGVPKYRILGKLHHNVASKIASSSILRGLYALPITRAGASLIYSLNNQKPNIEMEECIDKALAPFKERVTEDYNKFRSIYKINANMGVTSL